MPMSDRTLARLALQVKDARQAEQDNKALKDEKTREVVTELDRRGTRKLSTGSGANEVTITKVVQTETVYDWAALAEALPVRVMRSIQKQQVDPTKLAEAVQDGRIDSALVARCSEVMEKTPYVLVSVRSRS